MTPSVHIITSANRAVARMAYKTNEVFPVYPITPATEMAELIEEWSAQEKINIYGSVPTAIEMQSEAGVAGCMHGALQTGSLSATFTASQGLLLMMPNMYKMAGELTPNVIHVATRSVATHALSVFGDHSDIMAVRSTGYAFLGGGSVQEAQDFALIAQAATLESRIPFVHYFDGFRTSHEVAKIESISDAIVNEMINRDRINEHKGRALNPNSPVIRGTAQGSDVFFQSREAANGFYDNCPSIVQKQMDNFAQLTGRRYRIFEYVGHPEAEHIMIAMASATETIEESVNYLRSKGKRVGLIKVRLFRPFSTMHFIKALPKTCRAIAVLDRTKEPGAAGDPLYLDIVQSIMESSNEFDKIPRIVGGRYGLSSKEFNPSMVMSILQNLQLDSPQNHFTVGITDDITHLSLPVANQIQLHNERIQMLIYETKSETSLSSKDNVLQLIGQNHFVQGYTEQDYKKSGSRSVTHIRMGTTPIKAPYLISNADIAVCENVDFLENDNVLDRLAERGKLLINSTMEGDKIWSTISPRAGRQILKKKVSVFTVNVDAICKTYSIEERTLSGLHSCALVLQHDVLPLSELKSLKVNINKVMTASTPDFEKMPFHQDSEVVFSFMEKLLTGKGDNLPVSALPFDGTYPTDSARLNSRASTAFLPEWDPDLCTQCGACSLACPQGAIQLKTATDKHLKDAPKSFQYAIASEALHIKGDSLYTLGINSNHCTSCNVCVDACDEKAIQLGKTNEKKAEERWNHFETIPHTEREKITITKLAQQQLQQPLFINSYGVDGCGEAPYLKLISQLFGDRMLLANATGASSIFGGALPATPWSKNKSGRGVAWSNSLFEDNAEFGLGFRLSLNKNRLRAMSLLKELQHDLGVRLVNELINADQISEFEIQAQRRRVKRLKQKLGDFRTSGARELGNLADYLVNQSVWIVGGDGWAYDIGFGGLDHVLASGENVNILVLDNEAYSNTGGQMSKATPYGAKAKFAYNPKKTRKKDLGTMAMTYEGVYVASVAIGADPAQTLKAIVEAENYDGPSLIIAYCHSPSHGIDMKNPRQYHRAAVDSGRWPLYRNNPERRDKGLNPFQLDSKKPSLPLHRYFEMEKRYAQIADFGPELTKEIQDSIDRRFLNLLKRTKNKQKLLYHSVN